MFGPPQTVSSKDGGLHTAIGYWQHKDTYSDQNDYVLRKNFFYSQAAYGGKNNLWELYGRIGIADLKIRDAFSSTNTLVNTSRRDFEENGKFFGTLGAKGFYPINEIFGIGGFIQGSCNLSNFTDDITGTANGAPFRADMKIKNIWDVNLGVGLQATVPMGVKLYAGPYVYYSEASGRIWPNVPGLGFGTGKVLLKNKSNIGGYAGIDISLAKGFRLNVEGQSAGLFSLGAAITYTY